MDELSRKIKINMAHDVNPRAFALINTGHLSSSGEHWMGLVMNKVTKCCGYFNSFGRYFKWLHEPLKKVFNEVHWTSYVVQAERKFANVWTTYNLFHSAYDESKRCNKHDSSS